MSARWRGGGGPAEGLAGHAAGGRDRTDGDGGLQERAAVERRRQVVALDVGGQQRRRPACGACRSRRSRPSRPGSPVADVRGPGASTGAAARRGDRCGVPWATRGVRRARSSRRSAATPTTSEGQGGQQAQDRRPAVADRSVSAAAVATSAEHQERPQGDPGPAYADDADEDREQRDGGDDAADQHRLVVLAERLDRELLERPRGRVDARLPTASRGEVTPVEQRGHRLGGGDRRGSGEQARRTARDPAAARGAGAALRGLRCRGHARWFGTAAAADGSRHGRSGPRTVTRLVWTGGWGYTVRGTRCPAGRSRMRRAGRGARARAPAPAARRVLVRVLAAALRPGCTDGHPTAPRPRPPAPTSPDAPAVGVRRRPRSERGGRPRRTPSPTPGR